MILTTLLLSFQLLGRAEAFVQRAYRWSGECTEDKITDRAFPIGSWDESYALANAKIAQMTLDEKVGILTGVGQFNSTY